VIDDTYPPLAAWLYGERVADLHYDGVRGIHLTYTPSAIDRYGLNGLALSASMPVRAEGYAPGASAPYLDRLLPEGSARSLLERRFGVPRGDTFHLLEALGRDCAGAVIIVDAADRPGVDDVPPQPLSDEEIAGRLEDLPANPLGVDDRVRLSLAGMQAKLLLTSTDDGRFALPTGDAPSTHIMKPEAADLPGLSANEAWCLTLADRAGLPAASAEVLSFGGHETLVVERYDRQRGPDGALDRIHQEDACQALGTRLPSKYEQDPGGPTLRSIATLLRRITVDPSTDLDRLAEMVVFTVAIGNADLHGRNVSLLYTSEGPRLAPVYDAVATIAYDRVSTGLGMFVGSARDVMSIGASDVHNELRSWRLSAHRAQRLTTNTLLRLSDALDVATTQVPAAEAVSEMVRTRIDNLLLTAPSGD